MPLAAVRWLRSVRCCALTVAAPYALATTVAATTLAAALATTIAALAAAPSAAANKPRVELQKGCKLWLHCSG